MKRSRGLAFLLGALLVVLCAPRALADGKVFRHSSAVVPMVDQEAVIAFKNGVEVLAIRTRADTQGAAGESLAWVVPVPGPDAPQLLTTTEGTFGTARTLTQPRLRDHRTGGLGVYVLVVSLLVFLAVAAVRINPGVPARERALIAVIIGVVTPLLCLVTLLPSLAKARSGGPIDPSAAVEVLSQQRVGTLDVSVVRATAGADSAASLAAWLSNAGCTVPPAAAPVLAHYAVERWVFVAARLAKTDSAVRLEPTPLVMKFATPHPVYPMRLTGVGNGPLGLELCVLADGTVSAPGMKIARSSPLGTSEGAADAIELRHAGLASLAGLAGHPTWITRLSGTLSPSSQQADMALEVVAPVRVNESLYTREAARLLGFDIGAATAGLGLIALAVALVCRSWTQRQACIAFSSCLIAGTLIGFAASAAVPKYGGEIRETRSPLWVQRRAVQRIVLHPARDLSALRADIARWRADGEAWFDQLPEEGDRPWGYTLTVDPDGQAWIVTYDQAGAESGRELVVEMTTGPKREKSDVH